MAELRLGQDAGKARSAEPEAITRLDEVLGWLHWLTPSQRAVCWARADRWPWPRIVYLDAQMHRGRGRGNRQLRNIRDDGEARILAHLNGTPQRMRLE